MLSSVDDTNEDTTSSLREEEILRNISNCNFDSDPVLVPFCSEDLELWRQFVEFRKNRREWEAMRRQNRSQYHPPHIIDLFENWPDLKTSRLRLRPLKTSDDEDAFRLLSNPKTMKYYGSAPYKKIEHLRKQYIEVMTTRFRYRDGVTLVITMQDDDKPIGLINATLFDPAFKFTEISYILDPEHWGKGLATEAIRRAVKFFVEDMKIHKIRASFYGKNVASKRVLEKAGFIEEGYMRDNVQIEGEYEDEYLMALIAEDSKTQDVINSATDTNKLSC
jgi:[ribosomal protein S5]-alanine N-acetyltransferase